MLFFRRRWDSIRQHNGSEKWRGVSLFFLSPLVHWRSTNYIQAILQNLAADLNTAESSRWLGTAPASGLWCLFLGPKTRTSAWLQLY